MEHQQPQHIPSEYPMPNRIIVIGDIHGDMAVTIKCLSKAGVINSRKEWIGGNTIVVQMGDQVDRGGRTELEYDEDSDLPIMIFFNRLHLDAIRYGGAVFSLIGNHEIMNTMGIFDYVSPRGFEMYGGRRGRQDAFAPGSDIAKMMAHTRFAALKIGDCLFVHGGVKDRLLDRYSIDKVNDIMRRYLLRKLEQRESTQFRELFMTETSLLWNRAQSSERMDTTKSEQLRKTLRRWNANYLFVGHTPQDNGVNSDADNRVWRVDSGMSNAFGSSGKVQVLEIRQERGRKRFIIRR